MAIRKSITVQAPVNIAVIKYCKWSMLVKGLNIWPINVIRSLGGKQNEDLIIPLNDSVSGTLCMDQLCAKTTVAISDTFPANRMWLNGEEVPIESNQRLVRCIKLGLWNPFIF